MATTSTRKTKGRQKVAMVRMQKESNRLVTFSKRRSGLFKKASELCTLCGAEAAIIVFSPGNKAYSFGHPSVELISDRFLYRDSTQFYSYHDSRHARGILQDEAVLKSNKEVSDLKDKMDMERKRTEELLNMRKSKNLEVLRFLAPVEQLPLPELKQIQASLLVLRNMVYQHQQNMIEVHSISNLTQNSNFLSLTGQDNPLDQTRQYFPPTTMLGVQNYDPNLTLTQAHHTAQSFGDPSQMMMIPPPVRDDFDGVSLAISSNTANVRFANMVQPYQQGPIDLMHGQFNLRQTIQPFQGTDDPVSGQFDIRQTIPPFQGTNDPVPGQFDIRQTIPPFQGTDDPVPGQFGIRQTIPPFQGTNDPIHDQYDVRQNMLTDIARDSIQSGQQSLSNMLMGVEDNSSTNLPPPPFNNNRQGGFIFDSEMN